MAPSGVSLKTAHVQKVCTLWTHDENFSREDVVFNLDRFPELGLTAGSLVRIVATKENTAVRDFQESARNISSDALQRIKSDDRRPSLAAITTKRTRRNSVTVTLDETSNLIHGGRDVDHQRSYVFVCKPMASDLKNRYPNLQISISRRIAKTIGFRDRTSVVVTTAELDSHSASHVEIVFRDEYLARSDMWRLAISELNQRTVYKGQNLMFLNTIKATVKNIFVNGQTKHSGYVSSSTKPIFRSESARYVVFIQMSKEMWDFDTEGTGEIMFNKIINGFLPELFKRWMRISARHLVSIILFTRVEYDQETVITEEAGENPKGTRDFYRVVVSEMASGDWIKILYQLKKEFRTFLRDVSLVPKTDSEAHGAKQSGVKIAGTPSTASKGNILEAINLAVAQFSKDYIDRDLVRTGISVVVITPGTGVHEVDYNMLKLTTDTLIGTGIGIDLVCLSPMPLHSVPLFMYRSPRTVSHAKGIIHAARRASKEMGIDFDELTPRQTLANFGHLGSPRKSVTGGSLRGQTPPPEMSDFIGGQWRYAMPHWLDVSFWSGPSDEVIGLSQSSITKKLSTKARARTQTFNLRCRMYELQMMGVMENEQSSISVPFMHDSTPHPWLLRQYNDNLLMTSKGIRTQLPVHEVTGETDNKRKIATAESLRPLTEQERDYGRYLNTEWMRSYDDNAFNAPSRGNVLNDFQQKMYDDLGQIARRPSSGGESILSTSIQQLSSSYGTSARPSHSINLHQIMQERNDRRRSVVRDFAQLEKLDSRERARQYDTWSEASPPKVPRERSRGPSTRNADTSAAATPKRTETLPFHTWLSSQQGDSPGVKPRRDTPVVPRRSATATDKKAVSKKSSALNFRPGGLLSRHISFGGKGFAAPQVSVSAVVSSETSNHASLTRESVDRALLTSQATATDPLSPRPGSAKEPSTAFKKMSNLLMKPSAAKAAIDSPDAEEEVNDKPTQPITIRSTVAVSQGRTGSPGDQQVAASSGTLTNVSDISKLVGSRRGSESKEQGSLFLLAGSRELLNQVGPKINLSSSGGGPTIPKTLSPTSALSPWLVLVNPCNPKKNNINVMNQFRRWQHVFPRPLRTSDIKWKSLCSPASVPLTHEYFPTAEQLSTEYHESPYKVIHNDDDDNDKLKEPLVRELVAFRLSHGFQIVIGPTVAEVAGSQESKLANIFDENYMTQDGDSVYMSIGSTIHQLVCVSSGEVEVKRYQRKPTTALETSAGVDSPLLYKPLIRTQLEDKYEERHITLRPPREEYNWNIIDAFLAGYQDDFSDTLRFWRARFVLIPIDLPAGNRRPVLAEDSEEEVRLEGIRKLTQLWQKNRWIPPEERHLHAPPRKQKDPNPLAIEYQTRDPSAVVTAGLESKILAEGEPVPFETQLFAESGAYHSEKIDLQKLAHDLQGEKGIPVQDRRWHWRLHYNCFVGSDLTTWLLHNFSDIDSRDDAIELGNTLMKQGLLQHVQKRHQFRDGQYFYQIASEYRAPRPESRMGGWFGSRRIDKSVPSTPSLDQPAKTSTINARALSSRPDSASSDSSRSTDGEKTPTGIATPKKQVMLSHSMRYDVGARKKCYRSEIVNLHYDRLHNPDNCYHIRIDWMNVTSKLIEDAIMSWSATVEKFGLKLVELPIAEASCILETNPFRSPRLIRLAVPAPKQQPPHYFESSSFAPQPLSDKFVYHKALLRHLDFVLDIEAASSFPSDVDVMYSWGKPDFKFTQFIHKSGALLAQITDEGDFLMLANRLYNNRALLARETKFESSSTKPESQQHTRSNPSNAFLRSPAASPAIRPTTSTPSADQATPPVSFPPPSQSAESLLEFVQSFCNDEFALRRFYDNFSSEAAKPRASPSPHLPVSLTSGIGEERIPTLGLPPSLMYREGSPMRLITAGEGVPSKRTPSAEVVEGKS